MFWLLSCKERVSDDISEPDFSRKSLKYLDKFYKRHQDKDECQVGFGAGSTIFPLIAAYLKLLIHTCDFSAEALILVKLFTFRFIWNRVNVFIHDVTNEGLYDKILPTSVDVVTLFSCYLQFLGVRCLFELQNLKKVLKPDSHILPRDYAVEDFAQVPSIYYWTCHGCENVKLENRNWMISDNFYFRGDGTASIIRCSYCFSGDFLSNLFAEAGFEAVDMNVYCNLQTSRKWLPEFETSTV
ncbi:Methyltransferase-like protein 6 [Orobanche hederae]